MTTIRYNMDGNVRTLKAHPANDAAASELKQQDIKGHKLEGHKRAILAILIPHGDIHIRAGGGGQAGK